MTRAIAHDNRYRTRSVRLIAALLALTGLAVHEVRAAAGPCPKPVAKVVSAQGAVEVLRAREKQWQRAALGTPVCHGDTVRVLENGRAALALNNEVVVRLDQRSAMTFAGPEQDSPSLIELCRGALHFITRFPKPLRVITPFLNASVEGTEFSVIDLPDRGRVAVMEGRVSTINTPDRSLPQTCETLPEPMRVAGGGSALLTAGQTVSVVPGQAPAPTLMVRPTDAVQWALYYPPLIDYRGDIGGEGKDARFHVRRAGLLLQVGRVDEAERDIKQALALRGAEADAYALQAIVAVARNDKDDAIALARKAVVLQAASPAAHIALSYALQAQFKIEDALASARRAAELDATSGIAWARVAELEMSTGDLKAALAAAERAAAAAPQLSRTQTILGFAHLTRIDTAKAKEAFARAIELDSADPLPRLGNGLALVREGALDDGRKEIEIAAALDPGNALVRSYLGKAYYEEKRDKLATTQFDLAKALDPKDPTPWFYEAVQQQTVNRPVEGLGSLQMATSLNENRAPYRSRLLLDQDAAARGVGTARIYNDLGFEQLALVEGHRSVNIDPTNHAAHRFLADSYLTQPRRDIARVSELLQSQLLQPLTLNPIQPQLGEDKLYVVRSSGPAAAGFNEYNALFTRNRFAAQVEAVAGNKGTLGDQVVLAGIKDNVAWSLGQFHYKTDRFAPDTGIGRNIQNAFVQLAVTPSTHVQAEYRHSGTDRGDPVFPLAPDDLVFHTRDRAEVVRFGLRHDFSPGSKLLISAIHQKFDETISPVSGDFFLRLISRGKTVEMQHLLTSAPFTLVSGGSYYWADQETSSTFFDPFPGKQSHANVHLYGSWMAIPNRLQLLGGAAANRFRDDITERERVSPKLGLLYRVLPETTVRAAVFRAMKRPLPNNQTLEPTQFAGFNQFFDDINGTIAKTSAIGLDQKFGSRSFAGAEWFNRSLQIPTGPVSWGWREISQRAYWYWAPMPQLALSTEFYRDHYLRSTVVTDQDQVVDNVTRRIPVAVSLFNPVGLTGVSARLSATYVDQDVVFHDIDRNLVSQQNEFWVVDAVLSYRLPNRRGLLAIEGRNLLDRRIRFHDIDVANPRIAAARLVFARLVLLY